jgi:hypothetical protein
MTTTELQQAEEKSNEAAAALAAAVDAINQLTRDRQNPDPIIRHRAIAALASAEQQVHDCSATDLAQRGEVARLRQIERHNMLEPFRAEARKILKGADEPLRKLIAVEKELFNWWLRVDAAGMSDRVGGITLFVAEVDGALAAARRALSE